MMVRPAAALLHKGLRAFLAKYKLLRHPARGSREMIGRAVLALVLGAHCPSAIAGDITRGSAAVFPIPETSS